MKSPMLAAAALAGATSLLLPWTGAPALRTAVARPIEETAIRPFSAQVSDAAVADLRRRLRATRWPGRETVADASQGVQLDRLRELVRYWGTGYDWRRGRFWQHSESWP